jgi:hypothetical protein
LTGHVPEVEPADVDFRVANIMDYKPQVDGPWDLILFSDTMCYLGWLYPFFDVAWLAVQLFDARAVARATDAGE